MNAVVHTLNNRGFQTVRPSDDELHRAARKHLLEIGDALFGNLPGIIGQIIGHKVWKSRPAGFKNFAEYALAQTSEGLNINNNQKLWMLRCSLDVTGKHIKEWAEVLEKVEEMVRLQIATDGSKIHDKNGNLLETLAKIGTPASQPCITYLPSRAPGNNPDRSLVGLRKRNPDLFRQVAAGRMTLTDAKRATGQVRTHLNRAQSAFRSMTMAERREFIEWLRSERHI
jgi:hypothetical protein